MNLNILKNLSCIFLITTLMHCKSNKKSDAVNQIIKVEYDTINNKFSLLDYFRLTEVKTQLNTPKFSASYKKLLQRADKALNEGPFSVVNKTQFPPSGDKHDYITYGPYWWPDTDKVDGLPWIRKDGEINPLTRQGNTDFETKDAMFDNTTALSWAYFFSDKKEYAQKAVELLHTWFLKEDTKMNPNLNFAQGIPGKNTGRGIGIIEFAGITDIINAIEILELKEDLNLEQSKGLRAWFSDYLVWLQTSENGVFERDTKNNHGTYYDMQVVSIQLFLGKKDAAKEVLETAKTKRIASQIEPDGKQPHELVRTKSLSYSTMNLRGMTQLAYLGTKVGVDLWNYKAENGASIKKAYEFLMPYAKGQKTWDYKQIHSLEKAQNGLKQLFVRAGSIFKIDAYCEFQKNTSSSLFYYCD